MNEPLIIGRATGTIIRSAIQYVKYCAANQTAAVRLESTRLIAKKLDPVSPKEGRY